MAPDEIERLGAEGAAMTLDEAVGYALIVDGRRPDPSIQRLACKRDRDARCL